MPLKSKNPTNIDPHSQNGPFLIVDHDGDLPSMENVDEWCKEAGSRLTFVHTTLTKSDDILALAKCFDGWDNVILYSLEPIIFYDIDYGRLWVPREDVEVSVGLDGTVDEKALMGAFQAWRLEEKEKEKWRLGWAKKPLAKDPVQCREKAGAEGETGNLWEELKRLRL